MSVSIEVKGIKELFDKLGSFDAINVLEDPMNRAVLRLESRMKVYPPTRPNQRYVRTGTLGRRFTHEVTRQSNGLIGKVGNNTVYAPFVVSKQFQRTLFRGRWQTDLDVLESEKDVILRDFEKAIAEAI